MSAPTPGPWFATPYSSIVGIAITGGSSLIAGVRGYEDIAAANARLICAAPDLLALAHQFAGDCGRCAGTGLIEFDEHDYRAGEPCRDCADIRAVIAKAEGRV